MTASYITYVLGEASNYSKSEQLSSMY